MSAVGEICLCGHPREEHHDMAAECEFYGSNEEGGADEHGWPHCGRFVSRAAPTEARERWEQSELLALHRFAYERLRAAIRHTLCYDLAAHIAAPLEGPLEEMEGLLESRSKERLERRRARRGGRQ